MPRYIVESYASEIVHQGDNLAGELADYDAPLYLYELELAADPNVVAHHTGQGESSHRRAPYRECPWWVCIRGARAHRTGEPDARSTGAPL